jgi:hypothetical protein
MAQKLGTKALAGQWSDGCTVQDRQPKRLNVRIKSGNLSREGIDGRNRWEEIDGRNWRFAHVNSVKS